MTGNEQREFLEVLQRIAGKPGMDDFDRSEIRLAIDQIMQLSRDVERLRTRLALEILK